MRFAILGNAGSGKSTLAAWLAGSADLVALDLDTLAWEPGPAPVPRAEPLARADVARFCDRHSRWVIEGCYANLLEAALEHRPLLVLLNPGREQCLANCRRRPWEPHKFSSKEEQDTALAFLLTWVAGYYTRDGPMSLREHRRCFEGYRGRKVELSVLPQLDPADRAALALLEPGAA